MKDVIWGAKNWAIACEAMYKNSLSLFIWSPFTFELVSQQYPHNVISHCTMLCTIMLVDCNSYKIWFHMSFPCDSKIHHCVHVKRHVTPTNVVLHIPHVVASIMLNLLIYIKFVAMILMKWNGGHNISFVLNIHPNLVIT